MTPATATEISAAQTDVQGVAAATGLRLMGYSYRETSGLAVEFILRNGTSGASPAIAIAKAAASTGDSKWFGEGVACEDGVYVDRVSGNTHIVLWTRKTA